MEGADAGSGAGGVGAGSRFVCGEDAEGVVVFGGELFAGLGAETRGEEEGCAVIREGEGDVFVFVFP